MPDDPSVVASAQVQAMSDDVLRELQAAVVDADKPAVAAVPPEPEKPAVAPVAAVAEPAAPAVMSPEGARIMQVRDETLARLEGIAETRYWAPRRAAQEQAGVTADAAREAQITAIKNSLNQPAA